MSLGIVVIGRNEGQRLVRCLESLGQTRPVVYVDSGSTDDSRTQAESLGATVLDLDMSRPFSAARARNAGFEFLSKDHPDLEWVFFVDGDCQVVESWFDAAIEHMQAHPNTAVVCGRRKEIDPEASIYNALCDMEWNTPVGKAMACGGDALYRVSVFAEVQGFDPSLIAGEEPELCFRIRQQGYEIQRLDEDMTLHDAAMTKLSQWWKRTERSGHAYYLGWKKHAADSQERYYAKDLRSILFWVGVGLVFCFAALVMQSIRPLLIISAFWVFQILKIFLRLPIRFGSYRTVIKLAYACSVMFGKIPQALGVWRAWRKQKLGRQATLVEYK